MVTAKQKKDREEWWLRGAQAVVVVVVLVALVWYFTIGSQISNLAGKIGQLEALVGTKLEALTSAVEKATAPPKTVEAAPVDRTELNKLESGFTSQISQLTTRAAQLETLVTVKFEDLTKALEKSEADRAKALDQPAPPPAEKNDPRVDSLQKDVGTIGADVGAVKGDVVGVKGDLALLQQQLQAAARETDALQQNVDALQQALQAKTRRDPGTTTAARSWLIAVAPIVASDGTRILPVHLIDAENGIVYTWQLSGGARDEQLLMARLWGMAKGCDPAARPLDFLAESNDQTSPVNRLWLPCSFALNIRSQDVPKRVYQEFFGTEPTARATNRTISTPAELVDFLKIYPRLLTAEVIRPSYQR